MLVEEPVSRPRREPSVWKLLATMRAALAESGARAPQEHFFVFQWRTRRNNYVQILMKKSPLSPGDLTNLRRWLDDVDGIAGLEEEAGEKLGPIRARTTLLFSPDRDDLATNYARILRGEGDDLLLEARNLRPASDDRPFLFDVDPSGRAVRGAYLRTLLLALLLLGPPAWILARPRRRRGLAEAIPFVSLVALTGIGYLLVEVVLIQRYELLLGSPVAAFVVVLGTLLVVSGLGSLASGGLRGRGALAAVGLLVVALALEVEVMPGLLRRLGGASLAARSTLAGLALAPLAFLMGIPFPYALRRGKSRFDDASAGLLFAVNAAASALAVPLSLVLATTWGIRAVLGTGAAIYGAVALSLLALDRRRLARPAGLVAGAATVALLVAPWIGGGGARPLRAQSAPAPYRVYAASYGRSRYPAEKIFLGGARGESDPFAWYFWVVRGNGRTILVDTGFDDPGLAREWGIEGRVPPVERLRELGIDPDEVDDVILTHAHADHAGDVSRYRRARIWIRRREYRYLRESVDPEHPRRHGMRLADLAALKAARTEGRLILLDAAREVAPGIEAVPGGGHTPGSQFVTVRTLDGTVVLAGDETYVYRNNRSCIPVGSATDFAENLAAIRDMQRRAASPFYVIPGHDPRVLAWFPSAGRGIVRIEAREE